MIIASGVVRPYPGETASGDAFLVEPTAQGVLMALIDGLGHGPTAAAAAKLAVETIRARVNESPRAILEACHQGLLRGRGAVISVVAIDHQGNGLFSGVGNVSVRLCPQSLKVPILLPTAGVIGHQHRPLRETAFRLPIDGVGILHSDGVSSRADPLASEPDTLDNTAGRLLSRFGRDSDDACLVLFAHRGGGRFVASSPR